MRTIRARNVNDALTAGLEMIDEAPCQDSRNGPVRVFDTPVATTYLRPVERVLFSAGRDANPFFHLFESLWMLGGREDAEYLNQFVSDFGERYAEEDGTLWGAYGQRWIHQFEFNQLDVVVARLRHDWTDRRVVIQMWDPTADLYPPEENIEQPRDVPCNTQIYPRVRQDGQRRVLDITVCCRSNDMIWGAYGANAVHFSVLQEYLAARIGVDVGVYYQMSNNMHVYVDVYERLMHRMSREDDCADLYTDRGAPAVVIPMFTGYTDSIDRDIELFLRNPDSEGQRNPWYRNVALPMMRAHRLHKEGRTELALLELSSVPVSDWSLAGQQWLTRRMRAADRRRTGE